MARTLIVLGAILLLAGVMWPVLSKVGLGRLPGDIVIERGGTTVYIPLMTCLLISAALSVILWFLGR